MMEKIPPVSVTAVFATRSAVLVTTTFAARTERALSSVTRPRTTSYRDCARATADENANQIGAVRHIHFICGVLSGSAQDTRSPRCVSRFGHFRAAIRAHDRKPLVHDRRVVVLVLGQLQVSLSLFRRERAQHFREHPVLHVRDVTPHLLPLARRARTPPARDGVKPRALVAGQPQRLERQRNPFG